MEKECAGLLEIMTGQIEVYRKLLSLAHEKQPVLVKGDIPQLDRITKEEEALIIQVGRLEEQRQVLQSALANHFLLSPEELTFSELQQRVNQESGRKLQAVFDSLARILKELGDVNQDNITLLKNSLDYVNITLNLLTSSDNTPAYDKQEEKKKNLAKIFDHTV